MAKEKNPGPEKPVSLNPLDFEEALGDLLKVRQQADKPKRGGKKPHRPNVSVTHFKNSPRCLHKWPQDLQVRIIF